MGVAKGVLESSGLAPSPVPALASKGLVAKLTMLPPTWGKPMFFKPSPIPVLNTESNPTPIEEKKFSGHSIYFLELKKKMKKKNPIKSLLNPTYPNRRRKKTKQTHVKKKQIMTQPRKRKNNKNPK